MQNIEHDSGHNSGQNVEQDISDFIANKQSVFLSTLDGEGQPFASYAPFAYDLQKNRIYLLLSDLAQHGLNLITNPTCSLLICDDEKDTRQIFARTRLQYTAHAQWLKDDQAEEAKDLLAARFGDIIDMLQSLPDFKLFELQISAGRFVTGFGKTWVNNGNNLVQGFTLLTKDDL